MSKNQLGRTLIVGLASAATAMLLAPKSGKELRQDLMDQGLKMKDQAKGKLTDFADEVKQSYQEVEEEMAYDDIDLQETIDDIATDLNVDGHVAPGMPPEPGSVPNPNPSGGPVSTPPAATTDPAVPQIQPDVYPTTENRLTDGPDIPVSKDDSGL